MLQLKTKVFLCLEEEQTPEDRREEVTSRIALFCQAPLQVLVSMCVKSVSAFFFVSLYLCVYLKKSCLRREGYLPTDSALSSPLSTDRTHCNPTASKPHPRPVYFFMNRQFGQMLFLIWTNTFFLQILIILD